MDERQIELESKIAFLERTLEELSEVALEQGRTIEGLERRLASLEARLASVSDDEERPFDLEAEKPPHY